MSSISQRLYNEVMMADNFTCVYCGVRTPEVTVDHFIPRSRGGPDVFENLYACCAPCNNRKSDRPAHDVGMAPRFGRFRRIVSRPPIIADMRVYDGERIAAIAAERKADGTYSYSANAICRMVGGTRKDVLDQVRAIRNLPQWPETSPEQQAQREALGLPLR